MSQSSILTLQNTGQTQKTGVLMRTNPQERTPPMYTFGIMLGFFGVCCALDPNRARKKAYKKSQN
nr:MAG TPA: hypothetical protein [Caudoviricetes sp.]